MSWHMQAVLPFVTDALRCDILNFAIDSIAHQVASHVSNFSCPPPPLADWMKGLFLRPPVGL